VLRIDRLSVSRGDRVLFAGLHAALGRGELLHLCGANGCGKTSLLEVLAGLRRPAEGSLHAGEPPLPRHWIGHRNALAAALSPLENLRFWAQLNGGDPQRARGALERMGVHGAVCRRQTRVLSAGQKRRSTLARLLLVPRPLWLLDEPLDGLDVAGIALVADLLAEHLRDGGAVVMTSHQPLPAGLPGVRTLALDRLVEQVA
jgi:heme exporter protein A